MSVEEPRAATTAGTPAVAGNIVVLGGYGAGGQIVARALADSYPDKVVAAGRTPSRVATRSRCKPAQLIRMARPSRMARWADTPIASQAWWLPVLFASCPNDDINHTRIISICVTTNNTKHWQTLLVLCLAQFMVILDVTVVNMALPSIGTELGLGRAALTWVLTAYTLAFGGLMLLGGRLADVFGARRIFLAGVLVFTTASLVSGAAGDGFTLIAARVAQGAGAALLSPAALACPCRATARIALWPKRA